MRKHERIIHHHINTYDDWYRLIKATGKFVGSDNKSADYQLADGLRQPLQHHIEETDDEPDKPTVRRQKHLQFMDLMLEFTIQEEK